MKILIAIDDTDNAESKGTGFRARELASIIQNHKLGRVIGVTRHQLFVHENIPYTSHNSSACIAVHSDEKHLNEIITISAKYLVENAAPGSDAGLCVCPEATITAEILDFARCAKSEVLTMGLAKDLANKTGIFLEGYTGTKQGIIGSLAAVGLHAAGNDGRFLLAKGMREIFGIYSASEILNITGVEKIKSTDNKIILNFEKILLTEWWRPVLQDKLAVLYVESVNDNNYEYRVISKEHIKILSN